MRQTKRKYSATYGFYLICILLLLCGLFGTVFMWTLKTPLSGIVTSTSMPCAHTTVIFNTDWTVKKVWVHCP